MIIRTMLFFVSKNTDTASTVSGSIEFRIGSELDNLKCVEIILEITRSSALFNLTVFRQK